MGTKNSTRKNNNDRWCERYANDIVKVLKKKKCERKKWKIISICDAL